MQKLIILHSNDTHGRIEGLARIATLVERTRAENPEIPVLYLDAGDCEETSVRLSNLTKGVGMYRLLRAAGCAVSTIGNGGLIRYSHHILPEYARAAGFPLLLANLLKPDGTLLDGVQASTILTVGSLKLGIVGLTATRMSTHLSDNPSLSYDVFGLPACRLCLWCVNWRIRCVNKEPMWRSCSRILAYPKTRRFHSKPMRNSL